MAGSGLVVGFTPALLQQLRAATSDIPIDPGAASWIAAVPGLSLALGNLSAPPVMARYGRKVANIVSIVLFIVAWAFVYVAGDVTALLLARFLQGLCMGMCTSISSLLIGEYTSPKYRGAFLMTISVSIAFAVMCVHLSGSYLSYWHTALVCGAIAVIDLLIVINSPESPAWLAEKGKLDACKRSFRWLRGNEEEDELTKLIEASILLNEINARTNKPKSFVIKVRNKMEYFKLTLKKKVFIKPIVIMIHLYVMGQWSGINMLVAFPIDLFQGMLGDAPINVPLLLLSLDIHRLIANTAALYVIQKVKRRTILLITVCINILALLFCAGYSYAKSEQYISSEEYILGISLVHVHMFSAATGCLPLSFIIAGEVFPLEYRSLAGGVSVFFYSMNLFVTVKTVPLLLDSVRVHGTYTLYAGTLAFGLAVLWYMLPETKDRTLQDIEDEFRGRPLSPEELKSVQSLTSWKSYTTDRRSSGPVVA